MFSKIFQLSGLTCPSCQKISEMKLGEIPDVTSVRVDLASGRATIEASREITNDDVRNSLKETHYQLVE